jgi:lysozyme family protein
MPSFQNLKDGYERNWANLQNRPADLDKARREANRLLQGKATPNLVGAPDNLSCFRRDQS